MKLVVSGCSIRGTRNATPPRRHALDHLGVVMMVPQSSLTRKQAPGCSGLHLAHRRGPHLTTWPPPPVANRAAALRGGIPSGMLRGSRYAVGAHSSQAAGWRASHRERVVVEHSGAASSRFRRRDDPIVHRARPSGAAPPPRTGVSFPPVVAPTGTASVSPRTTVMSPRRGQLVGDHTMVVHAAASWSLAG